MKNEGTATIPLSRLKELESIEKQHDSKVAEINEKLYEAKNAIKELEFNKTAYIRLDINRHETYPFNKYYNMHETYPFNKYYNISKIFKCDLSIRDAENTISISPEYRKFRNCFDEVYNHNRETREFVTKILNQSDEIHQRNEKLEKIVSEKISFFRRIKVLFTGKL